MHGTLFGDILGKGVWPVEFIEPLVFLELGGRVDPDNISDIFSSTVYSLPTGKFFPLFCLLICFFKINFFENVFQDYDQNVKQFWIQILPDGLSGLIWVQIVCKSHQQTTLRDKELISD